MALILSRADVERVLTMPDAIAVVEGAFRELAAGAAVMPVRATLRVADPPGMVNVMPAYLPQLGALGLKLVSGYATNPRLGLPTVQATILYTDPLNGRLLAVMEGGYITAVRTGAASGVATQVLARPESATAAVIGSGVQAATQLEAVCAVRPIRSARVYSPSADHRGSFAARMTERLGIPVRAVDGAAEAVRGADVVIAATNAREPVVRGSWLAPGTHVNGVGTHAPTIRELDSEVVRRATVVVDSLEAALQESGDLLIPLAAGEIDREHVRFELGAVLLGQQPGRMSAEQITLFKSNGLAVQDVATAKLVYDRARAQGLGREVEL